MSGYLITLDHMVIAARSGRQRRQAHSSTRAELLSLYDSVDCVLALRLLLIELGIPPGKIGTTVWCDNDNAVENVRSVNPRCTELCSEVLARQLRNVFMHGHTEDAFRLAFPRAAEILEGTAAVEDVLVMDVGEGTHERFQPPTSKTDLAHMPVMDDIDMAHQTSIASRLQDGCMALVHISGVHQLGDALTKSDVSIHYLGRVAHLKSDFLLSRPTSVCDLDELSERRPHYKRKVSLLWHHLLDAYGSIEDIPYDELPSE